MRGRPIERRTAYDKDLAHLRRFRDALALDTTENPVHRPVLEACDMIFGAMLLSNQPELAMNLIQTRVRAIIAILDAPQTESKR